ncbi:MAG: anthranilate synthase component I family protein [Verrucomicrobiae bacterium]|nr:anthranilate synthase component I family protein [Verrucomicrobiae bacterium]
MHVLMEEVPTGHTPESLAALERPGRGLMLLRTGTFDVPEARYSFVVARPMLRFRSWGTACETRDDQGRREAQFGNPWQHVALLLERYELPDVPDAPFPLGGCFGYWGYDLKQFVEPRVTRRAVNDLELPDCDLGFHPSLVVFDHQLGRTWVVATGLDAAGNRSERSARRQLDFWRQRLRTPPTDPDPVRSSCIHPAAMSLASSLPRTAFLQAVERALQYIRAGDIYQVNLAHRLGVSCPITGWAFFLRLAARSPAPFAAFLDCGRFQVASSSPELFLRISGRHIITRPIKGTRPRHSDPVRDAQLSWELQRSEKENAELVMITDLLRNDLGRVCEFGSIRVPDLARLERFAQVQHLVSTVEGRLAPGVTHLDALAACFPGGSITGAPKVRAMEIIDALEPVARGPYCGCHGYLGFNHESQFSITIRTALVFQRQAWFHVGAGIVADSNPVAEYEETLAKAGGFLAALEAAGAPSGRPAALPGSRP